MPALCMSRRGPRAAKRAWSRRQAPVRSAIPAGRDGASGGQDPSGAGRPHPQGLLRPVWAVWPLGGVHPCFANQGAGGVLEVLPRVLSTHRTILGRVAWRPDWTDLLGLTLGLTSFD